jgi:hypothetical protein
LVREDVMRRKASSLSGASIMPRRLRQGVVDHQLGMDTSVVQGAAEVTAPG